MFMTKLRMTGLVLLVLGVLGAGAGVVTQGALAEKRIDAPEAQTPLPASQSPNRGAEKPKPKPKEAFENDFGYAWIVPPADVTATIAALKTGGQEVWINDKGVALLFSQAKDGDLFLVMAGARLQEKPGPIQLRPVVLDAARKRYLPYFNMGGAGTDKNKVQLTMGGYRLSVQELPIDKIRYVGVEQMTDEGRKAIIARALERARKAGIEILPPSRIGEIYDFALTTLDGKPIRSRDLLGKVVLIDCWSTGCAPCLAKMPKLKQLYEKRHEDGLEILGVSLDKDAETVEKACAKRGLTWPQVLVPSDGKTRELWYEASGMVTLPRLLVLDRKGILRADCGPDQLEKEITKVLDQVE